MIRFTGPEPKQIRDSIFSMFEEVVAEGGTRLALIEGHPGTGKTRIVQQAVFGLGGAHHPRGLGPCGRRIGLRRVEQLASKEVPFGAAEGRGYGGAHRVWGPPAVVFDLREGVLRHVGRRGEVRPARTRVGPAA